MTGSANNKLTAKKTAISEKTNMCVLFSHVPAGCGFELTAKPDLILSLLTINKLIVCVNFRKHFSDVNMYWPSSLKVDQEYLVLSGNYLQRVKMFPHFDLAHYTLVSLTLLV